VRDTLFYRTNNLLCSPGGSACRLYALRYKHTFSGPSDAALLDADKMPDMSLLITDVESDERQDWKFYSALTLAVAPLPRHERGRFSATAFGAFDADCELQGGPEEIAPRWFGHADIVAQVSGLMLAFCLPRRALREKISVDVGFELARRRMI